MSSTPVTTFWRIAGMSYLQYVSKAATSVRGALKEPAKRKAMGQEAYSFNRANWEGGVQGTKMPMGTGPPPKK